MPNHSGTSLPGMFNGLFTSVADNLESGRAVTMNNECCKKVGRCESDTTSDWPVLTCAISNPPEKVAEGSGRETINVGDEFVLFDREWPYLAKDYGGEAMSSAFIYRHYRETFLKHRAASEIPPTETIGVRRRRMTGVS